MRVSRNPLSLTIQIQGRSPDSDGLKHNVEPFSDARPSMKVSIDRAAVTDLGPSIRNKIRVYLADYLGNILDLSP
jgi:hypothetical protein